MFSNNELEGINGGKYLFKRSLLQEFITRLFPSKSAFNATEPGLLRVTDLRSNWKAMIYLRLVTLFITSFGHSKIKNQREFSIRVTLGRNSVYYYIL